MELATAQLADGPRLHYAASGAYEGDPILFLHGWPDSWFSFSRLLPLLPPGCRPIAPDQRGFGESPRPATDFAVMDFAGDAAALLDALHIERATVVGHSFGSFVARRLALSHPDRVRQLVLIGSGLTAANDVTREVLASLRDLADPIPLGFVRKFQASTAYPTAGRLLRANHRREPEGASAGLARHLRPPAVVRRRRRSSRDRGADAFAVGRSRRGVQQSRSGRTARGDSRRHAPRLSRHRPLPELGVPRRSSPGPRGVHSGEVAIS